MLPRRQSGSDRELYLYRGIRGFQTLYLDAGRVKENLLSVGQAGTVKTDVGFARHVRRRTGVIDPTLGLAAPARMSTRSSAPRKAIAPHVTSDRTKVMLLRMFCTF